MAPSRPPAMLAGPDTCQDGILTPIKPLGDQRCIRRTRNRLSQHRMADHGFYIRLEQMVRHVDNDDGLRCPVGLYAQGRIRHRVGR